MTVETIRWMSSQSCRKEVEVFLKQSPVQIWKTTSWYACTHTYMHASNTSTLSGRVGKEAVIDRQVSSSDTLVVGSGARAVR